MECQSFPEYRGLLVREVFLIKSAKRLETPLRFLGNMYKIEVAAQDDMDKMEVLQSRRNYAKIGNI